MSNKLDAKHASYLAMEAWRRKTKERWDSIYAQIRNRAEDGHTYCDVFLSTEHVKELQSLGFTVTDEGARHTVSWSETVPSLPDDV